MRLLLVRLRPIGDVVFTTPLLAALRRRSPDAHVAYVVEPTSAPILQQCTDIDELIIVPKSRGLARLRDDLATARRLLHGRFDVAIDLHGGPRSAWFTWASRAPMRIGYTITGRTWMYTHAVARAPQLTPRHSVMNQWDLLAPLGIPPGDAAGDPVRMAIDPAASARVSARLEQAGIGPEHAVVLVHASASNRFKRWPEASFVSLIEQLVRRDPSRRVVLISGPADASIARRIGETARDRLGPLSVALPDLGSFELPELAALSARAALYVGGDSGPLHVAATTAVPIVELLGPTLAERSHPWRDPRAHTEIVEVGPLPCRPCHERVCVPGDFRCLTGIAPERVVAAAERALQTSGPPATARANERRMPVAHP